MKALVKSAFRIAIAVTISMSACKRAGSGPDAQNQGDTISKAEIKEGVEKIMFPLPEPMNVYQTLENIGATYASNALNPVNSIDKYFQDNVKAVNLGVYSADLSYATIYDKKNDVDAYSKNLKSLIDDLDIKVDYAMLTSEETRKKAENSDSLIKLTTQIFYDVYGFLNKESNPSYAALMANGYYVEGLYIATHLLKETYNNFEMLKIVCQQATPLEEIIKLNEKFPNDQYIQTLQSSLKKLKAIFDEGKGSVNEDQLQRITKTIEAIRGSMVS